MLRWIKINARLIGVIITIFIAIPAGLQIHSWLSQKYYNTFGWKIKEQQIINKLSPSQPIQYFNSILGPAILVNGGEKYTEAVFKRKGYWIQAVYGKNNRVELFSITNCSDRFFPEITTTPLYKTVTLGKDTMSEVSNDNIEPHYFISGATAPSFIIDEVLAINPTKYQTTYFGVNDACDFDPKNILSDDYYYNNFTLRKKININHPKIKFMRENLPINTFAITSPNMTIEDLRPNFFIGVNRIDLRVLPGYSDSFLKNKYQ